MLSKVHREILVSLELVQNFEISDLSMEKVETINITVTYPSYFDLNLRRQRRKIRR
jgi:hypothetical protein